MGLQKTLALGSLRRSDPGSSVMFVHGGTIVLTMTSGFHEVVEARQSRDLECAVWRRACGKANVEMNSRLGDGQPPGLKSADRAKRGIYLTASR